jgi:hypothetical protein
MQTHTTGQARRYRSSSRSAAMRIDIDKLLENSKLGSRGLPCLHGYLHSCSHHPRLRGHSSRSRYKPSTRLISHVPSNRHHRGRAAPLAPAVYTLWPSPRLPHLPSWKPALQCRLCNDKNLYGYGYVSRVCRIFHLSCLCHRKRGSCGVILQAGKSKVHGYMDRYADFRCTTCAVYHGLCGVPCWISMDILDSCNGTSSFPSPRICNNTNLERSMAPSLFCTFSSAPKHASSATVSNTLLQHSKNPTISSTASMRRHSQPMSSYPRSEWLNIPAS